MDINVDKTIVMEMAKSIASSTAVWTLYVSVWGVCKLTEALEWLAIRMHNKCKKLLSITERKKSGLRSASSRVRNESEGYSEVPSDKITESC